MVYTTAVKNVVTQSALSGSFEVLEKEYTSRRSNLIPFEYDFLINFGEVALRDGHMRRAVEITREALVHATTIHEKASVYLALSKMYRMMIQMQNARSELGRAFDVVGERYPSFGGFRFISSLSALFLFLPTKRGVVDMATHEDQKLLEALYEEAGLSAYYMRSSPLLLLQISLRVRKIVHSIGVSFEMANYLSATATVFAIYGRKSIANYYLLQSKKIVSSLGDSQSLGKYHVWEILVMLYLDNFSKSFELTEKLLLEQKESISFYDTRLICTTLSNNYSIYGKTKEALKAIDQMYTAYDYECSKIFSCNKTFIEWYKILSLSFLGEEEELDRIIIRSQAIFSSLDEEKWQITLFLGNMLIYHYLMSSYDLVKIRGIFERFNSIKLSPRRTFLEAQHYWIGKAYILLDLYHHNNEDVTLKELSQAIEDVKKNIRFKVVRSHYFVLVAHLYYIQKSYARARKSLGQAVLLSKKIDNDWSMYEADKLEVLIQYLEKNEEREETYQKLVSTLQERGWHGCERNLAGLISNYR